MVQLSSDGASGELCFDAPDGETDLLMGSETVYNHGEDPVTLQGVELVEPRGVRVVESFVLPQPERDDWSAAGLWPRAGDSRDARRALEPIPGATLVPTDAAPTGKALPALLLHLKVAPEGGSFDAVQLTYEVEGEDELLVSASSQVSFAAPCPSS